MEQINSFGNLIGKYAYGEDIVQANGGFHIEKSIQQTRPSLLPALQCNYQIPFGPPTITKAVIGVPSEGEESEIDITDIIEPESPQDMQQQSTSSWPA